MYRTISYSVLFMLLGLFFSCESSERQPGKPEKVQSAESTYREPHRPRFHFSPTAHWMNDPNGMCYYQGEYHLFYQYYPGSTVWGPMHWGHAVSPDLIHWEHLPIALYPDSLGYIFSGSAVVDWNNTSGFGKDGQPPLVAIFTYHDPKGEKAGQSDFQSQGIAFSHDKGRTWIKYDGNPVIPNSEKIRDFRDPKVSWDDTSGQWVMVFAAYDHVKFWGSKNLKEWTHLSDWGQQYGGHGGVWECPDLFPMQVGNTGAQKWVLLVSINPGTPNGGSGTQYFVGDFDGTNFSLDPAFERSVVHGNAQWIDYGRDNYAGVTWSDIPSEDGRRLFMGWMSNWDYAQVVPTGGWRSAMTLPRSLVLKSQDKSFRVYSEPVIELRTLHSDSQEIRAAFLEGTLDLTGQFNFQPTQIELELSIKPADIHKSDFGVELVNSHGEVYRIGYNGHIHEYYSDRTKSGDLSFSGKFAPTVSKAPRQSADSIFHFHLFFDVSSAELFADRGATVMTEVFFPAENFTQIKIYADKGLLESVEGKVYKLKGIWN